MLRRYRRIQNYSSPLSDIEAEAIVADRDYVSKVIGASPAIVFQFIHMENEASVRTEILDQGTQFDTSIDIDIRESYARTKQRSVKQIAAGKRWSARMNDDGDKINGFDDGEWEPQSRCAGYYADI